MASWKDLYALMSQGAKPDEVRRKLKLPTSRLVRLMRSKFLARALEVDVRLVASTAVCLAANEVKALAREGITPADPTESRGTGTFFAKRREKRASPRGLARLGRVGQNARRRFPTGPQNASPRPPKAGTNLAQEESKGISCGML